MAATWRPDATRDRTRTTLAWDKAIAMTASFDTAGDPDGSERSARLPNHRERPSGPPARILFTSQGRTALIHADDGDPCWLDFDVPDQVTWQPGGFFPDGRVLLLSMETRRDGPGRPFKDYYHQTPTHLWIHDLDSGSLEEILTRQRPAAFVTPQLVVAPDRLVVQVVRQGRGESLSVNLDGTDAQPITGPDEGMPYGFSLSPDGRRLAFHLAAESGYQICTCDLDGGHRVVVDRHPDYLYFGPTWSPDGDWLAYQACRWRQDPGHDGADLCLARPDGSQVRFLTGGQALWFAASYGSPGRRGGGSNVPCWTRDGAILISRRLPGSRTAWPYQSQRTDTDHFNRDYRPDLARGGAEICRIDPRDGAVTRLTCSDPPVWDFRQSESPDGTRLVFCRAATGDVPAIWIATADGSHPRVLTRGLDEAGADHPQWMPGPARETPAREAERLRPVPAPSPRAG